MVQYIDNFPMYQTFLRGETLASKYANVYISDSMTVKMCNTLTNYPIGTVDDASSTLVAGTSVKINLFNHCAIRKVQAGGVIAAGAKLTLQTGTTPAQYITATGSNTMALLAGIAVTSAPSAGSIFTAIPFYQFPTFTA